MTCMTKFNPIEHVSTIFLFNIQTLILYPITCLTAVCFILHKSLSGEKKSQRKNLQIKEGSVDCDCHIIRKFMTRTTRKATRMMDE